MNFGTGTDLRILHKFLSNECYTNQFDYDYNYHDESYALNGEKSFKALYSNRWRYTALSKEESTIQLAW